MSLITDVGGLVVAEVALDSATITAGAGNDGLPVTGRIIDLIGLANVLGAKFTSGKLSILWKTTLTAAKTLSILAKLQHGSQSNLSDAADYLYSPGGGAPGFPGLGGGQAVVKTAGGAGDYGRTECTYDLSGAKQYIRATITADLSNTVTDTVTLFAVMILGGSKILPAT